MLAWSWAYFYTFDIIAASIVCMVIPSINGKLHTASFSSSQAVASAAPSTMENHILVAQQTAGVARMAASSVLAMLPFVTCGAVGAYLPVCLPQLLAPNTTGIQIDLFQMSWLCTNTR